MNNVNDPLFTEEQFDWLKSTNRRWITREQVEQLPGAIYDLNIREGGVIEMMRDQMLIELNAHVLGRKLPSFVVTEHKPYSVPKNPWQMFKDMYADKWFMRWIARRWPVKTISHKVTLTATWEQWATYPWLEGVPVSPKWQPVRVVFPARTRLTAKEMTDESTKPQE